MFSPGHLAEHPLPTGIAAALSLTGYQLLSDVAGVGAGRLGSQAFLLVASEPDASGLDPRTQLTLHQTKLRDEREAAAFRALASQLGYLRLSGYRLSVQRVGLRSRVSLIDPATGAIAASLPEKHPGKLFRGGATASALLSTVRSLPPASMPPDTRDPESLRQLFLAIAIGDASVSGVEAAEIADRAVELSRGDPTLEPRAAIEAAKKGGD